MKKFLFMILACTALTFACKPETPVDPGTDPGTVDPGKDPGKDPGTDPGTEEPKVEYYNSITATLGGATMKTTWEDGDEIQIYNVTQDGNDVEAKYVLKSGAGSATGTFEPATGVTALEKGGKGYFASYPYNEDMTFAQHNTFSTTIAAERNDAAAPMFAYADDAASLNFSSFMGAVKFTLSGKGNIGSLTLDDANSNNIMSGNVTVNPKTGKVTFKNGAASKNSISYKFASKLELDNSTSPEIVIEIPAGCLAEGGSMTLIDMNNAPLAVIEVPGKTVEAGKVAELGKLEFQGQSQTIDLSAAGSANCYIIPDTGSYKFKAVKGNSNQAVEAATVEVLWETWNERRAEEDAEPVVVDPNSIVASVAIENGYVMVTMAEPVHPGNAVIAAKDGAGTILWSWHLWVPETPVTDIAPDSEAPFFKTAIMDRNLGALIVCPETSGSDVPPIKSYGMYFEWGRKDPFTGPMAVSGAATEAVAGSISLEDAIANPTMLPSGEKDNADNKNNWCSTDINDLWGSYKSEEGIYEGEKTIYDPCPPGYKVPAYNTDYLLWYKTDDGWTFDLDHAWFKFNANNCVFPAAGYLSGSSSPTNEFKRSVIWSATYNSFERGYDAHINMPSSPQYNYNSYYKYAAGTVRCVIEH